MATPNLLNPFQVQLFHLNAAFYLSSSNFIPQIRVLEGALGFLLLVQIATIILRYRSNSLWFFRFVPSTHSSSNRSFIVPNSIVLFTFWGIIYGMVLQGFLSTLVNYATWGASLENVMIWRGLSWIPLWISAWMMTWSTFLSPILANQSKPGHSNSNGLSGSLSRHPILVNTFFLSVPCIVVATLVPLSYRLNSTYNYIFGEYRVLAALVTSAEINFDQGIATNATTLLTMGALINEMNLLTNVVYSHWTSLFVAWAVFIAFCGLLYCFSAIVHFRSIGNAMSQMKLMPSRKLTHSKQLAYSYRCLAFTTVIIACMCVGFTSLDIIVAARPQEISQGGLLAKLVLLVYLYFFLLFGSLSSLSILIASIITPSKLSAATTHPLTSGASRIGINGRNQFVFAQTQTVEIELEHRTYEIEAGREIDLGDLKPWEGKTRSDQPFWVR